VLYETLTGRVPYSGSGMEKMWAHANDAPPATGLGDSPADRALDAVVSQAMAKDPNERYQSAGDLGRAAVAASAGERLTTLQGSVATGAAATGVNDTLAPTKRLGQAREPVTWQLPPGTATEAARPPARRGRRTAVIAAACAALAVAGAAGFAIASQSGDDGVPARTVTEVAKATSPPAETATTHSTPKPATRKRRVRRPQAPPSTTLDPPPAREPTLLARPAAYTQYAQSSGGYSTELPTGSGWSAASESEPTPGRLYRTVVRGPGGFILLIDYTPSDAAGVTPDADSVEELSHPSFGSMTEYVFSGGSIPECANTTCVDYIMNAGSGYAVLAGGSSDFAVAREVAHHVAESLRYGDY
jgi:hypothetical protein